MALSRAEALAAKPPEALRTTRALLRRGQAAVAGRDAGRRRAVRRLLHGPEARAVRAAMRRSAQRQLACLGRGVAR